MRNGWRQTSFADICDDSAFGPRFSGDLYASDGNVATLRTTDIASDGRIDYEKMPLATLDLSRFERHILRHGDLVITRTGRVGTTAVFDEFRLPVLPGAFLIRFRLNRALADPSFYRYFFNSPDGQALIQSVATGSVQQNLNITNLHALPLPLPPLTEQRAIAGVLGTLDDKIEQNRRTAEALERLARGIFRAWFVDFEPVHAKAAGATSFPSMPQEVFDALPNHFTDSELGPVPEGWEAGTLGDIATEVRRAAIPTDIDPETPYIGLEHMPRCCIALSEWEPVAKVTSNKSRFEAGQILFGKLRPYFHKVGVAPIDGVCSTDIVVVQPTVPAHFGATLGVVSSDDFVAYTNACSTGTKMPRTKWDDMKRYGVAIPPAFINEAFTKIIRPLTDHITASIHESRKLAELRDYLLPKLLSGEVRVTSDEAESWKTSGDAAMREVERLVSDAVRGVPRAVPQNEPDDEEEDAGEEEAFDEYVEEDEPTDGAATVGTVRTIDEVTREEVMAAFRTVCRGRGWMSRAELIKETSLRLGYLRVGSRIERRLRNELRAALRRRIVEADGPDLVRGATATFDDFETDELVSAIGSVVRRGCNYEREEVIRAVATHLGFQKVTATVRDRMRTGLNAAIRRGLLSYSGTIVWREN